MLQNWVALLDQTPPHQYGLESDLNFDSNLEPLMAMHIADSNFEPSNKC
jgi:hypothetical protein